MLLEGIFLPLTTPFHPDGRLYLRKLESNVDRYSRTPAAGMLVLGGPSEGDGLTDREVQDVLSAAIGAAADEKVMVAGVGRASVAATLARAEIAAAAGYDAIAVRPPDMASECGMQWEMATYFNTVADRSPLPVVLVSERDRSLSFGLMAELAWHPRVIGAMAYAVTPERLTKLKESTAGVSHEVAVTQVFAAATGRMLRRAEPNFVPAESLGGGMAVAAPKPAVKTRTKKVGFQVLPNWTGDMLVGWNAGAVGAVPRLGACAPQACCEVWQAFKDGDPALAAEKQQRILSAGERMEGWGGIAALKYACDLNAYFGGRPRLPMLPLTAEERAEVEREMARLQN
jgi:dihydrodipicolinate synthase/N-acetylneuraminate lyase